MMNYVLMGGGGLALELFEYMQSEGNPPIGYYAPEEDKTLSRYLPWMGDEREQIVDSASHYVIASGILSIRRRIIAFLEERHLLFGSFVSKRAYVSSFATLGKGVVVVPGGAITGNALIGDYTLVNLNSVIAHDVVVGNNVVVGPGVMITGHCKVGNHVTFGANSSLLPGTQIGNYSEIGIGSFCGQRLGDHKIVVNRPGHVMYNFKEQ